MSEAIKKKKKRRSQAPVALVYFATMLVFLGGLSFLAIEIMQKIDAWKNPPAEEVQISNTTYNTLYICVNSKNVLANLWVARVSPDKEQIVLTPMSAFTVSSTDNKSTFREVYENGGIRKLRTAVEQTFDISTDFYISLTNSTFESIADIMGGIVYTPTEDLYYLSKNDDNNDVCYPAGKSVSMQGRQIRLVSQYPVFSQGRGGNTEFLGESLFQLVNSAFQQSNITKNNLENMYKIMTNNSDTNLNKQEFKTHKVYLNQMLSSNLAPAIKAVPQGKWTDESHFVVSEEFIAELKQIYKDTEPDVQVVEE